jgi:CYTH domain-containing protein
VASYCDPFGAAEYLVDDIAFRQMVGSDYLRMGFYTQEQDEKILRVRLVFPVRRLFEAQAETRLFITRQQFQLCRMAN